METISTIYHALITLNRGYLSEPTVQFFVYIMLFSILFLENSVLPAAFLPGDSLLFITGVLIGKDVFHFGWVNFALIAGASMGTWFGYFQGRWLGNTRLVQRWLRQLPAHYHQRSHMLMKKYGLAALFIGRFIPFVRTLLPILAGLSGLQNVRFHIYNWVSAILWIFLITSLGYLVGISKLFENHEQQFLNILLLIPVVLLLLGLITSFWLILKRWKIKKQQKNERNSLE